MYTLKLDNKVLTVKSGERDADGWSDELYQFEDIKTWNHHTSDIKLYSDDEDPYKIYCNELADEVFTSDCKRISSGDIHELLHEYRIEPIQRSVIDSSRVKLMEVFDRSHDDLADMDNYAKAVLLHYNDVIKKRNEFAKEVSGPGPKSFLLY